MSEILQSDVSFTGDAGDTFGTGDGAGSTLREVQYGMIVVSCGAKGTVEFYSDEAASGDANPVVATTPEFVIQCPTAGTFGPPMEARVYKFRRGMFFKVTLGTDVFVGAYIV